MEDRYLFKAKHMHILPGNDHLDGSWVVGFLSGERYITNDSGEYLVDPSTVCQCTGLKDKNGKLIWENDIVNANSSNSAGEPICVDGILVNMTDYDLMLNLDYSNELECVGNIFDNPELLESEG